MKKVYLIQCAGFYKIGISKNPKSRLKTVQTHNPLKVSLVANTDMFEDAESLEKHLHKLFANCRARGEWFELFEEHLTQLKNEYRFYFHKPIQILLKEMETPKSFNKPTIDIRSLNSQVDDCVSYYEYVFSRNVLDIKDFKKSVAKYGSDLVKESIDDVAAMHWLGKYDYYLKVFKVVKSKHLLKTNPKAYLFKFTKGIYWNKFSDELGRGWDVFIGRLVDVSIQNGVDLKSLTGKISQEIKSIYSHKEFEQYFDDLYDYVKSTKQVS